jgi:hypothetical protein
MHRSEQFFFLCCCRLLMCVHLSLKTSAFTQMTEATWCGNNPSEERSEHHGNKEGEHHRLGRHLEYKEMESHCLGVLCAKYHQGGRHKQRRTQLD